MPTVCVIDEKAPASYCPYTEENEFRQLRHHTRNALQRILIKVLEVPGLGESREGRRIADEVARRIELSVAISDALFGLTQSLEPLSSRLRSLSESVIALYSDKSQVIRLNVTVSDCEGLSRSQESAVLRITHELVANAVKHGMHMRVLGRISIRLAREVRGAVVLAVTNDGWRMEDPGRHREGLKLVEDLARAEGGDMLVKTDPQTTIKLRLPVQAARGIAGTVATAAL